MPTIPPKNVQPFKKYNSTLDQPSNISITTSNEFEMMNSYFPGTKYQCADGLNECINSCCYNGRCLDPSNVCLEYKSTSHLIIILTAIIFGFLIVFYWVSYHCIGLKHNASANHNKDIYNRRGENTSKSREDRNRSDNITIKRNTKDDLAVPNIPHSNLNINK